MIVLSVSHIVPTMYQMSVGSNTAAFPLSTISSLHLSHFPEKQGFSFFVSKYHNYFGLIEMFKTASEAMHLLNNFDILNNIYQDFFRLFCIVYFLNSK